VVSKPAGNSPLVLGDPDAAGRATWVLMLFSGRLFKPSTDETIAPSAAGTLAGLVLPNTERPPSR
jgi:hypothetical protein